MVGEGGDLVDENEQPAALQGNAEDYTDPNWEPEPVDAGPGLFVSLHSWAIADIDTLEFRTGRPSDIITTLVSIYDSKDLFVKELQVLLAQRLLAITDGNFDREVSRCRRCRDLSFILY